MTYFLCFCWRVEEENKWKKRKRNLLFLFFHLSARQLALSVLYQLLLAYLIFSLNVWWKFAEIWWKIAKLRSARSRSYQRIFEFFLRVRWEGAFNSQFLKEKRQNSKKKREKNLNENCKNHDFCGFFDFEVAQKRPYQRVFEFFLRDDVECNQISALVKK